MKTFFPVTLALALSAIPGGYAWGQFGRFIPIPRPVPVRLPVHPPVHPPFHPPTSSPQDTDPSQQGQPSGNSAGAGEDVTVISLACLGFGLLTLLVVAIALLTGSDNIGLLKLLLVPVIGLLKLLIAPIVALRKLSRPTGLIRIVEVPPGEAPRSVREAWVGLELPLVATEGQGRRMEIMGVLSHSPGLTTGYAVDGRTAIDRLGSQSPEAARWWRENACHVLVPGYQLVFPSESCRRLG